MISLKKATELIQSEILKLPVSSNVKLAIMPNETVEFEYGWVFFYQSEEFVKTGNLNSMVGGNAPLLLDKYTAQILTTGTRMGEDFYIEKYLKHRDSIENYYNSIQ